MIRFSPKIAFETLIKFFTHKIANIINKRDCLLNIRNSLKECPDWLSKT